MKNQTITQKGISIIELLIAITISIIIISAAVSTYISTKTTLKKSSQKEETVVKALDVEQSIEFNISNNGFACPHKTKGKTFIDLTGNMPDFDKGIIFVGQINAEPTSFSFKNGSIDSVRPSTDYIAIQRSTYFSVIEEISGKKITLTEHIPNLEVGSYLVSCNNENVELLEVANINNLDIILTKSPIGLNAGDFISDYSFQVFYTASSIDKNNKLIPSLYVFIRNGKNFEQSYELIRNVNKLNMFLLKKENIKANQDLKWTEVFDIVELNTDYSALKLKFDINDSNFQKIIPTEII